MFSGRAKDDSLAGVPQSLRTQTVERTGAEGKRHELANILNCLGDGFTRCSLLPPGDTVILSVGEPKDPIGKHTRLCEDDRSLCHFQYIYLDKRNIFLEYPEDK